MNYNDYMDLFKLKFNRIDLLEKRKRELKEEIEEINDKPEFLLVKLDLLNILDKIEYAIEKILKENMTK